MRPGLAVKSKPSDEVLDLGSSQELLRGPIFEPLRNDPHLFGQVKVDEELGTILWPNGADIDPVILHGSAEPAWKDEKGSSRAG